ncbi:transposase domain-containing protein [Streptomyces sp. NPDC088775]|uniref:transposase domain-containing protein n=1 Tax=Streptomyces sp. NPDC088775 TaxID=3365896 RepID=UPI00381BFB7F
MHPWIGLSDEVRLGLLTEWIVPELVDEVLTACGRRDAKPRPLSSRFMVYFVLALALFQQDSYDDVAENLVGALGEMDQSVPNKSSFARARQQLGSAPLEGVFRRVAGAIAPPTLEGGVLARDESCRGRRVLAGRAGERYDTCSFWWAGGQRRSARRVPAGQGGDADRDQYARDDRRADRQLQGRWWRARAGDRDGRQCRRHAGDYGPGLPRCRTVEGLHAGRSTLADQSPHLRRREAHGGLA